LIFGLLLYLVLVFIPILAIECGAVFFAHYGPIWKVYPKGFQSWPSNQTLIALGVVNVPVIAKWVYKSNALPNLSLFSTTGTPHAFNVVSASMFVQCKCYQ
jgi:hypothetical protein